MNHLCQDCNRVATHANPMVLCDRCWARRNSTQYMNGKAVPYSDLFKSTMPKGMETHTRRRLCSERHQKQREEEVNRK